MSKTNVIKFVTDDAYIYDYKPMAPSMKYAPEWWKKLPKHFVSPEIYHPVKNPTVKGCPGFIELYKHSFALPLDLEFELSEFLTDDNRIGLRYFPETAGSIHPDEQSGHAFAEGYHHFKIHHRWSFATETLERFLVTNNFWGDRLNIHVVNGVMPIYNKPTPMRTNMFIPKGFGHLHFKYGDIVAHIIPLSGKKYVVEKELMIGEEYEKYHKYNKTFGRAHLSSTRIRKEMENDPV